MYDEDDEFLRSIPPFLRRYQAPPPRKLPIRPRDLPARSVPAVADKVVEIAQSPAPQSPAPRPPAPRSAVAAGPVAQRARIVLAFENQDTAQGPAQDKTQDTAQDMVQNTAQDRNRDDVTFRVTLPRDVARQICMLAAEQDITQRAVVLHALGLAGFSLPEGSELDRPAKRQA